LNLLENMYLKGKTEPHGQNCTTRTKPYLQGKTAPPWQICISRAKLYFKAKLHLLGKNCISRANLYLMDKKGKTVPHGQNCISSRVIKDKTEP
jgi:hypothetical protein